MIRQTSFCGTLTVQDQHLSGFKSTNVTFIYHQSGTPVTAVAIMDRNPSAYDQKFLAFKVIKLQIISSADISNSGFFVPAISVSKQVKILI